MRDFVVAITAASYSGNKGAAAMLVSSIKQLRARFGDALHINLMSVYPRSDREQIPFDFVKVVSCKPEQIVFIAFPLALLYYIFRWLPPLRWLLTRNKILKAYTGTDLVLDEAGISFVDSRGFVMNTYAFITMAVPLLMGVKVVKYSQALGTFKNGWNRFLAKLLLPKLTLICARGEITRQNLADIGITKNVVLCADGAFSMPDNEEIAREVEALAAGDDFYKKPYIALSLSSVVDGKCQKLGIPYRQIMVDFTKHLVARGYGVLLIANAARMGSDKPRNNDLMVCDDVYATVEDERNVRWYHEEMTPEKVRELIGRSAALVASRFHALIAGLERQRPVLLMGWSHKYKEVLDMFGLGAWALDFSKLSLPLMTEKFDDLMAHSEEMTNAIAQHLPQVLESSRSNIGLIGDVLEDQILAKPKKVKLLDFNNPGRYTGEYLRCRMGYATDESIRNAGASGGMVTALLCRLLRDGEIEGAWVTRSYVQDGALAYETFIATTEEEIRSCSSSIYMEMPLMKKVGMLEEFDGRVAVVLLPCQMRALAGYLEKHPVAKEKVVLKIALYCSGSHDPRATTFPLAKKGIGLEDAKRLIFRRGHHRGYTVIQKQDGTEETCSYTKTICTYKNAYYFSQPRCMICQDQFGKEADLSFGDIWLKEMKANPIKHTSCLIHNERGDRYYRLAAESGDITDLYFSRDKLIRSQKRALVFKYNCAGAKAATFAAQGKDARLDTALPCKLRHRLAWKLARRNQKLSFEHPERVQKIPLGLMYYYMAFIRLLLS